MRRIGAVEFATTIAPGLRDVLLTGKIKEIVVRTEKERRRPKGKPTGYDAVVVDSPPTGRIARFLDVTKAVSDLAKGGPVHSQADGVVKLLHSELTAIHLVTLLEALPIQETAGGDRRAARSSGLPIGSVIVNRNIPAYLRRRRPGQGRRGRRRRRRRAGGSGQGRNHVGRRRLRRPAHRDDPARDARSARAPRAPRSSTRSTSRGSNCPRSPTASTSAACTNSPKHSPSKECDEPARRHDEHHTRRPRHGRDPGRPVQPRRRVLRRRRCRQDDHRRGDGAAGRRVRPHRRRAHHRPGQAARAGARHQGPRQHAAAGAAGARGHRRTARDDARHASHVRRDGDPVLRPATAPTRSWRTSSTKPSPRRSRARRSTWPWRSSASCSARTSGTSSSSTLRRRAMRSTSSTRRSASAASWTVGCGACCWRRAGASAGWSPARSAWR